MDDGIDRDNLEKLANYLLARPANYGKFNVIMYSEVRYPDEACCGTAGCAIGHGAAAGITPLREKMTWWHYSDQFIHRESQNSVWCWCFSPEWYGVDNTASGTALRIKWFLDHGLPGNWKDQMYGIAPLCYLPKEV